MLVLMLLFFFIEVQAQHKDFEITGKVIGQQSFNYAFAYDNESNLICISKITAGNFVIKGVYSQNQRFNEIPYTTVILSKDENGINGNRLSKKLDYQVQIMLGEPIELIYDSDKKHFKINGGELNSIHQQFQDVYWEYRHKRDSTFAQIDKLGIGEGNKNDQKVAIDQTSFSIAINKTIPILLKHPESEVSLFNFSSVIYDQSIPSKIVMEIFNKFSSDIKDSEYGQHLLKDVDDKIAQEEIMNNPAFNVGMVMPIFELPDVKKELVKSNIIYGKYTLIDFWATWCTPCRNETPNLISALEKYQGKGLKIITVSLDVKSDLELWLSAVKNDKMDKFSNLINDSKSTIVRDLKIVAIPANYLIDQNGKIIAINLRGEELQNKLKSLMP